MDYPEIHSHKPPRSVSFMVLVSVIWISSITFLPAHVNFAFAWEEPTANAAIEIPKKLLWFNWSSCKVILFQDGARDLCQHAAAAVPEQFLK